MEESIPSNFGDLLRRLRKQQHITQQEAADRIGVHRNTIGGWERGEILPESKTVVMELAHQLRLDPLATRRLLEASLTSLSPYWLVPYPRNPFFTGREDVLKQLHNSLTQEHVALVSQSYALSGLGGIGKTQTAIEYAYRYTNNYTAVFWISTETYENIVSSTIAIATLLNLPEKQEHDQEKVVAAVTHWMSNHRGWLLILDNVEDPAVVKRFLPPARGGSLLFTSRRQALGLTAQTLDLKQMTPEEGIRFLLHRARLLEPAASLDSLAPELADHAREIVAAMDGLPLALDQAGAYVEATRCRLSDYLQLFQSSRLHLLDERDAYVDHPLSVTRTFALAFEQLEQSNALAIDLLTVCAFLVPEAIPETLFIEGASYLGPTFEMLVGNSLQFNAAIKALLSYSLLQRHIANRTVTVHRLVQTVLKGRLSETVQRTWVTRVVYAMSQLFPTEETQLDYWQICEGLLPHALICVTLGGQWVADEVLNMTLMSRVAAYLSNCARYAEAEALFQQALRIGEQVLGTEHPQLAYSLHGLADLLSERGKYSEAESLFQWALRIGEQTPGADQLLMARSLDKLGLLYGKQGKYEQAKPLYLRALQIGEQILGSEHPQLVYPLNNLGLLYFNQGKYIKAESFLRHALQIGEQMLGSEHPRISYPLNNLANVYNTQGKYEQAEPLYQRALRIQEQTLGPEHPQLAYPLNNLANVYNAQGKYEQAESLYRRALRIREQALGPEHSQVGHPLNNLAELYRTQGKYEQAEPLYRRALHIWEQALGPEHPLVADSLTGLADLYREQGKYEQAEPLYWRALHIREQKLGFDHPNVADPLTGLATLLSEQGKYEEAELLYQRALALRQEHLGPQHPLVAETLYHLAHFHHLQQHITEALPLYQQTLVIYEQVFGVENSKTRKVQSEYFLILKDGSREKE